MVDSYGDNIVQMAYMDYNFIYEKQDAEETNWNHMGWVSETNALPCYCSVSQLGEKEVEVTKVDGSKEEIALCWQYLEFQSVFSLKYLYG